ncbi:MAG: ATP-binding cassette domain-containing protein [Spirochaetales bacterium]
MVEVSGLCKAFHGKVVLKSVALRVAAGEVHGLLGRNGAGKTTLLRVFGLDLAAGVNLVWSEVANGSFQVVLGTLLVLPCLVVVFIVVMLARSYLVALAFAVGAPLLSLMALNLGNVAFDIPWLCPMLLTADTPTLESLGLDPAGASRSWPVYTIFSLAVIALAYGVFHRKAADS